LVKSYDRPEETLSKRSSHYSRHLVKMLTRLSLFDCQRATETIRLQHGGSIKGSKLFVAGFHVARPASSPTWE
jgi:hypothetical protein